MMPDDAFKQLFDERHDTVMRRLDEIYAEARDTNGKVNDHAERIARLEERNPGKQGGIWGSIGGAVAGFLTGLLK